ncbi:hypothetical protein [Rhizobium paknamense]|uniref:hypothetical protein n=1 Tax=Rhizobium paknamense TaxID=1206817 RepID=UPI00366B66C6
MVFSSDIGLSGLLGPSRCVSSTPAAQQRTVQKMSDCHAFVQILALYLGSAALLSKCGKTPVSAAKHRF